MSIRRTGSALAWSLALILVWAAPAVVSAGALFPGSVRFEGELGYGYDGNAYRQNETRETGPFVPYELRASTDLFRARADRASVRARLWGYDYARALDDGDRTSLQVHVDSRHDVLRRTGGRSPARLRLAGSWKQYRKTFVSRRDGEELAIELGDEVHSLADRLNYRQTELEAEVRLQTRLSLEWAVLAGWRDRDYDNDYDELPTVDPLDHGELTAELRVRCAATRKVRAELEYGFVRRKYSARAARDLDGGEVAETAREFRIHFVRGGIRWAPVGSVQMRLRVTRSWRDDPFVGYYDYRQWKYQPDVRVQLGRRFGLSAGFEHSDRDYPRARVAFDPEGPLHANANRMYDVEGRFLAAGGQIVFVRIEHHDVERANPTFTYDRTLAWLGYRFRLDLGR